VPLLRLYAWGSIGAPTAKPTDENLRPWRIEFHHWRFRDDITAFRSLQRENHRLTSSESSATQIAFAGSNPAARIPRNLDGAFRFNIAFAPAWKIPTYRVLASTNPRLPTHPRARWATACPVFNYIMTHLRSTALLAVKLASGLALGTVGMASAKAEESVWPAKISNTEGSEKTVSWHSAGPLIFKKQTPAETRFRVFVRFMHAGGLQAAILAKSTCSTPSSRIAPMAKPTGGVSCS